MHCGPHNQNFGWAMAHPAHAAAPPMCRRDIYRLYLSIHASSIKTSSLHGQKCTGSQHWSA